MSSPEQLFTEFSALNNYGNDNILSIAAMNIIARTEKSDHQPKNEHRKALFVSFFNSEENKQQQT